jgi:hypothetical protein
MKNLKNKDQSIQYIVKAVIEYFGNDYFDKYLQDNSAEYIDFWEADLCAIGFKKNNKVIYIYSFNALKTNKTILEYYSEFEKIDEDTLETLSIEKVFEKIYIEDLIKEMNTFLD